MKRLVITRLAEIVLRSEDPADVIAAARLLLEADRLNVQAAGRDSWVAGGKHHCR